MHRVGARRQGSPLTASLTVHERTECIYDSLCWPRKTQRHQESSSPTANSRRSCHRVRVIRLARRHDESRDSFSRTLLERLRRALSWRKPSAAMMKHCERQKKPDAKQEACGDGAAARVAQLVGLLQCLANATQLVITFRTHTISLSRIGRL